MCLCVEHSLTVFSPLSCFHFLTFISLFLLLLFLAESGITETEKIISKVLDQTGIDIPRLIVTVTLVGGALLLFNIVSTF